MSTDDQKPCRLSEDLSFLESSSIRYRSHCRGTCGHGPISQKLKKHLGLAATDERDPSEVELAVITATITVAA
jgi:hypothetical protein